MSDLAFRSKASNGYDANFMEACRNELTYDAEFISAHETWIADQPEHVVGFLSFRCGGHVAEIEAMFIDPSAKGTGVGKLLWQRFEERVSALKIKIVEADSDPFAVGFYENMGMVEIGLSPSGSIPGRNLPVMRKEY